MALLDELRRLPPRTILATAAMHVPLLAALWTGALGYLTLQVLLAAELVVLNLATIPFYRERGAGRHLRDTLMLAGGLLFVLCFLLVTYGVALEGDSGNALMAALGALARPGAAAYGWGLLYVVVHVVIALQHARAAPDPRRAWAQGMLAEGGVTFIAMFFMVFAAIFAGRPIVAGLELAGVAADVDAVLGTLMVVLRFGLSLVAATITPREMDAIAANPYAR
ncbi:MAG TPA: hypothetical protein VFO79_14475 [Xanthomonadales bacterium]|nr:hypothetical protein [Xanthomonadales bacterium]